MKRRFNVTGLCHPAKHYMVDITNKLEQIKEMIDDGDYFIINRGRQFGKTTTLTHLEKFLKKDYIVIFLTFEGLGNDVFSSEGKFCQTFLKQTARALKFSKTTTKTYVDSWLNEKVENFDDLNDHLTAMCQDKKIILMIDEVDQARNHALFLNFLGVLRKKFLASQRDTYDTFHSVILAGVYDIKNIKLKMMNEGTHIPSVTETKTQNSPWNIVVNFGVDMSFSPTEITTMLAAYEKDYLTGMDLVAVSEELYAYTSGYPFMVSRLCQLIHDEGENWDIYGVRLAVSVLLREDNQLFKDMSKNLENNQQLYELLYAVLILGYSISFSYDDPVMDMAYRYGYIKFDQRYAVGVFNKIFETRMSYYFVAKNVLSKPLQKTSVLYHNIVTDDCFNMALCLEKFAEFFNREIFPAKDKALLEEQYRISFLSYLKLLLNGTGHYHQESRLIDDTRMDLVVNYGRHEYIIELKRIFSERDRIEGIEQLLGYLESRRTNIGYYLTFDFRKKSESKVEWLEFDGKSILEVSV